MSGRGGPGSGAALRLGLDPPEGGPDGRLPCCRDPSGPPLAGDPEVGAQLAGIVEPGRAVLFGEREFLGDVGTGPRTSRKPIVCGRSKVTVSSVVAVSLP